MKNLLCCLILMLEFLSLQAQEINPEFAKIDSLIGTSDFKNALLLIESKLTEVRNTEEIIRLKLKRRSTDFARQFS